MTSMRKLVTSVVAVVIVASGACGGSQPDTCVVGGPCTMPGNTTGMTCVGTLATDNGQPFCSCRCSTAADGGTTVNAGACGTLVLPDDCSVLVDLGQLVTPTCVAGTPPAMTGGTIADGAYVLESAQAYGPSCAGLAAHETTLFMHAGCLHSADSTGGQKAYTSAPSGSALQLTEECPGSGVATIQYSATTTTLTELAPYDAQTQVVSVFRLR